MKLNKLAFTTMKPRNALAALTLAGSLCALAPQAYAYGIDFNTGTDNVAVASTSFSTPTVLRTVTATCPLNGFLYAMAGTEFSLSTFSTSAKKFYTAYSLSKDSTATDQGTDYELDSLVQVSLQTPDTFFGAARVASNPVMRVDSCTAGQSVTYRFLAFKGSQNASDTTAAVRPKLVVTFHPTRI